MSKRKRVVLSLNDKIKIIESLKKGVPGRKIAEEYGVGTSTISDIKKNVDSILEFTCKIDCTSKRRKSMKKPKNELLEDDLYCWFLQQQSSGKPVSGPLLREKALEFNKIKGGDESFVASNGWLFRFKSRYGIKVNEAQNEINTTDTGSATSLKYCLKEELRENINVLDHSYSFDENGLDQIPSKPKCLDQQEQIFVSKRSKEEVTILVCGNAIETLKIPLILMEKSKNPKCFKNIKYPIDCKVCQKCSSKDIKELPNCVSNDQDFQILSHKVTSILQTNKQEIQHNATEKNLKEKIDKCPSHLKALQALETALKWFKNQTECDADSLLQLKKFWDLAFVKKESADV